MSQRGNLRGNHQPTKVQDKGILAQGGLQAQLGAAAKAWDQHHKIAQQPPIRAPGRSALPQRLAGRQLEAYPERTGVYRTGIYRHNREL